MTPERLVEMVVQGGYRIKCDTVEQRRAVLEFFDEQGIRIGPATRNHLKIPVENDVDTEYMYPGYNEDAGHLSLWRVTNNSTIEYERIEDIVEGPSEPLDNRNDAEFAKDFALLLQ